jgi:hypothetical protein
MPCYLQSTLLTEINSCTSVSGLQAVSNLAFAATITALHLFTSSPSMLPPGLGERVREPYPAMAILKTTILLHFIAIIVADDITK